jgi:hypothetical protein
MVKLQLLILPNITGYLHIQTNPKLSYSTAGTISDAHRKSPDLHLQHLYLQSSQELLPSSST